MALYFMWSCNHCELFNSDETNHCQACFNKTTKKSAIYELQTQQRMLFDGFIRTEVLIDSQHQYDNIPTYLFDFTFAFFRINIKSLCESEGKIGDKIEPPSRWDFAALGLISFGNKEYFFSYQIISTLIKFHPEMATFHNSMALILSNWNNEKDAENEFQKAIQIAPGNANYKRNYGITLIRQKKWKLALEQFVNAFKLTGSNKATYAIKIAICYREMKDYELSNFYYLKAIELKPSECKYYYWYGKYLRERGKYEEADKYYKKSLEINPEQKYISSSYSYLLYLMGRIDEAQKYIDLALTVDDTNEWAYYYQGLIYKKFGEEILAEQALLNAIKVCKSSDDMMPYLENIKQQDPQNIKYHDKCGELLRHKFKSI